MGAANLLFLLLAPLWAGLSLGAAILTFATLWPVYLSLIGNVDSTKEYPRTSSPNPRQSESSMDDPDESDPIVVLKREYALGNISEPEFERRLNTLLEAEGMTTGSEYRTREPERN
ncbi:SHOCT domain-containing protein [Haladaptatus cibarius]|uniref:hypothetical protein n=1 Tax=Haladaptatus cibarius TaxID=453847 RepID=UPI00067912E9|nr:hypothetical protein [Haladaptatus cibarius]